MIGREFDLDLLATVAGISDDAALDALDAATAASLVQPIADRTERFSFVHALIEHTLYDELSPPRRRRAHRRVAEALSSLLGPDPVERIGELANHWVAAEPGSDEAIDYAVMAGQHAMHNLAPQDGVHWFREALRLLDARPGHDPHRRCTLLVDLGVAQRDTGDGTYRDVLLDAAALARELDAPALLVRAALSNTRGWASSAGSVDQQRVDVLEAALEAVGPDDSRRSGPAPGHARRGDQLREQLAGTPRVERRRARRRAPRGRRRCALVRARAARPQHLGPRHALRTAREHRGERRAHRAIGEPDRPVLGRLLPHRCPDLRR